MANLFTSQTPSSGDNSDGTPGITFAVTVVFASPGQVTGVRFFATSTVSGTYTGALWTVDSSDPGTGTALATKTLGVTPTSGAWNTITFDSPVSVTAGVAYRAGVFSGAGRYVATLSFFGSGLTNGNISAPAHNGSAGGFTVSQGTFRIDSVLGYPNSPGGGGTNYFADVEFTASGAEPGGIAVPAALGQPAAGIPGAAPSGLAVAMALGAPTVALNLTAAPGGLAVPVALGSPSVGLVGASPTGIAVAAAAGTPAAALDRSAAPSGIAVPVALGSPSPTEPGRAITTRPFTGITARPNTGITLRP